MISSLTALGLAVATGLVKYLTADEGKQNISTALLGNLDTIFGGVLGSLCHEGFSHLRNHYQFSTKIKGNADVERCSRDALLRALIAFNEEVAKELPTGLSAKEKNNFIFWLDSAQKNLTKQLRGLSSLPDNDPALNQNSFTEGDMFTPILAETKNQEKIAALKRELLPLALREYGYAPEHPLYPYLMIWFRDGLSAGQHWFVYYIQALNANLKNDEPEYCKKARRVLTLQSLQDLKLFNKANLALLNNELLPLMTSIQQTVLAVERRIEHQYNQIISHFEELGLDISNIKDLLQKLYTNIPDITVFEQYQRLTAQLKQFNNELETHKRELEELIEDLQTAEGRIAVRLQKEIGQVESEILKTDDERQKAEKSLQQFVADIVRLFETLAPASNNNSERLQQARQLLEQGDYEGADAVLNEDEINKQIAQAEELNQRSAQELIAKADLAAVRKLSGWLEEASRLYQKALTLNADNTLLQQAAYFFQTHNQFRDAIQTYSKIDIHTLADKEKGITLNNLGVLQAANNDYGTAEASYQEALQIRRQLAQVNPAMYLPDVATTLNNLGILQKANNDYGTAEASFQEALQLYRQLAQVNPAVYLPNVATTLNNLGILQADNNDYGTAEASYQEALQIRRQLAQVNPAVYLPDVAMTLNNLGVLQKANNDYGTTEASFQEALQIRRQLAQVNPAVYLPDVAMILNNLGILQAEKNDYGTAEASFQEALQIRRQLAQVNPAVYLPDVATTLNNLGNLQKANNDYGTAEASYQEALQIRRQLAQVNPAVYLPDVAMILNNLGNLQAEKNDYGTAEASYQEALQIRRQLAQVNPAVYLAKVAKTLNNLGNLKANNDYGTAEASYQEALNIHRNLTFIKPAFLAQEIIRLSIFYIQNFPAKEKSLLLAREAFAILQPLHGDDESINQLKDICNAIVDHWEQE